jgi:hypothetical protein
MLQGLVPGCDKVLIYHLIIIFLIFTQWKKKTMKMEKIYSGLHFGLNEHGPHIWCLVEG